LEIRSRSHSESAIALRPTQTSPENNPEHPAKQSNLTIHCSPYLMQFLSPMWEKDTYSQKEIPSAQALSSGGRSSDFQQFAFRSTGTGVMTTWHLAPRSVLQICMLHLSSQSDDDLNLDLDLHPNLPSKKKIGIGNGNGNWNCEKRWREGSGELLVHMQRFSHVQLTHWLLHLEILD
jgi:hypothetical protein